MKKEKVYCSECRSVTHPRISDPGCIHPNNMRDTYFDKKSERIQEPSEKNKNSDCKDFESEKVDFKDVIKKIKNFFRK